MKKIVTSLLSSFFCTLLFAQDVSLNDSVIFINNKPVALFYKQLNKTVLRYDLEVYSFSRELLVKAEVIKFDAPVDELRPFYYYELSSPPLADTFAIYIEEEAFPLVLGKMIRDYDLVTGNQLNKNKVADFKARYPGGPALLAKIKSVEDHLVQTRHFDEQVQRDRTKPVTIINDKIIMQDGVRIGMVREFQNFKETNQPIYTNTVRSTYGKPDVPITIITDYKTTITKEVGVYLESGRKIDYEKPYSNSDYNKSKLREDSGKSLYEISRPKKPPYGNNYTDNLLKRICYLVEEYAL